MNIIVKVYYTSGRTRKGEISQTIESALKEPYFLLKVGTMEKEIGVNTRNVEDIEPIESHV